MKKIFFLIPIFATLINCSTISIVKKEFKPQVVKEEYFGMHYHEIFEEANKDLVKLNGSKYWRLWDSGTLWADLEPEKGKWDFSRLDSMVETAKANGIELLFTMGLAPQWACKKPYAKSGYLGNTTSNEPGMEHWKTYVKTLGERYKGAIKYWEIWNEPNFLWFYTGRVGYMAKLTKEASVILKNIDPENIIVSPSVTGWKGEPFGLWWLSAYFSYGIKDYVDIVGFHIYTGQIYKPQTMIYQIAEIKRIMKFYKIDKPIWNTEGAYTTKNVFGEEAASAISGMHLFQTFMNVERFYFYAFNNNLFGKLYDKEKKELNENGKFYNIFKEYFSGKNIVSIDKKNKIWICELTNGENKELIIWSEKKKDKFEIVDDMEGKEILDLYTGDVSTTKKGYIELGITPKVIIF